MNAPCYDYKPSFNVMKVVKAKTFKFGKIGCHQNFGRMKNDYLFCRKEK